MEGLIAAKFVDEPEEEVSQECTKQVENQIVEFSYSFVKHELSSLDKQRQPQPARQGDQQSSFLHSHRKKESQGNKPANVSKKEPQECPCLSRSEKGDETRKDSEV